MLTLRSTWPPVFTFGCGLILYLAYAANNDIREWIAGVLIAAVATLAAFVVSMAGGASFRLRWRDLFQAWRIPWYLLADTAGILATLGRRLWPRDRAASRLATVHFDVGAAHRRDDAGRRALAVTFTSSTPNAIVLGFDRKRGLMVFHQLFPAGISAMTRNLGATP